MKMDCELDGFPQHGTRKESLRKETPLRLELVLTLVNTKTLLFEF